MTERPKPVEHERYEELCALASAGALTDEESEYLFEHLDECAECSKHFAEYQSLATEGIPQMVDLHRTIPEANDFNEGIALDRLLKTTTWHKPTDAVAERPWVQYSKSPLWQTLAVASLLIVVAVGSYRIGKSEPHSVVHLPTSIAVKDDSAVREVQVLQAKLQESKRREEELQSLISQREADLERAHEDAEATRTQLERLSTSMASAEAASASKLKSITEERDQSTARILEVEQREKNAQDELNTLRAERRQAFSRIASLEGQVGTLNLALNDQNNRSKDYEQYLASDKDIRDLIGARNLYIADIMDVREDGSSRKPFGRVFYTKTKSLIFYAYDLDKQPGVKQASTFQVWGRTGPDDRKPLNLGILYLDSEMNRRWTLRVNNPQQLAQLDAVFVTVEQREQSDKPTGKPFLYASLRREPNHP